MLFKRLVSLLKLVFKDKKQQYTCGTDQLKILKFTGPIFKILLLIYLDSSNKISRSNFPFLKL